MQSRFCSHTIEATLAFGMLIPIALALVNPTSSFAQDNPEQLVVTATRTPTAVRQVPRSVTVIAAEELREALSISPDLGVVLGRLVPGMNVGLEGRTNATGQDQLRGRRIQLLIDGVPQDQYFLDFRQEFQSISPEAIERIEVIRGGSAVYGIGATGGIINIITKRPKGSKPAWVSSASLGGQAANRDSLSWKLGQEALGSKGAFDYYLGAFYESRGSQFDARDERIPTFATLNEADSYNVAIKLGYDFGNDRYLSLSLNRYNFEQDENFVPEGGVPGRTPARAVRSIVGVDSIATANRIGSAPPTERTIDNIALLYEQGLWKTSLLSTTFYYQRRSEITTSLIYATNQPAAQRPAGHNEPRQDRHGLRLNIDTPFKLIGPEGNLVWGADYDYQDFSQPNNVGLRPVSPDIEQKDYAFFAQAKWPLSNQLVLSGGVRFEELRVTIPAFVISETFTNRGRTVQGGTIKFRETLANIGLVYEIGGGRSVFASFAQGFNGGEVLRAVRNTSASSVAEATELKPLTADNYEIGLRGGDKTFRYTAAAFYSTSDLGATFTTDPRTGFSTVERAPEKVWGAELTFDANIYNQWDCTGSLSIQEGYRELNGRRSKLPGQRIAPFKAVLGSVYRYSEHTRFRIEGIYSGEREKFPGSTATGEGNVNDLFLVNLSAEMRIGKGRLSFAISNVFNKTYVPPPLEALNQADRYYNGQGRAYQLSYRINW